MSAAEKLRALEKDERWRSHDSTVLAGLALSLPLPQIVAVVEAAENAVTCAWIDKATDEQNEELRRRADAIPTALAALEEALK